MTYTTFMEIDKPRERYYEVVEPAPMLLDGTDRERKYLLRLRDLPKDEKPREKLIKHGPAVLSSSELLEVLWNVGTTKEDVRAMSHRFLKEYGEGMMSQKDPERLSKLLDIPIVKACQLVACIELGRRFLKMPDARGPVTLHTASQVFAYLKDMREQPKENLRGLYLDPHYHLIHDELISVGTTTANLVHPPEVFKPALAWEAAAIILAHNHPSGVVTPSTADIEVTQQIIAVGTILNIPILDHIVVTKDAYESVPVKYE